MNVLLFKVLVDGKPCHGGEGAYPPLGEWTEPREPRCCESGYHLTSDPLRWWRPTARLYLAEGDGKIDGDGTDKAAFERVRLVAEVTRDWPLLCMFPRVRAFLAASARSANPMADISWADLSWANLSGADLSWVRPDLGGAYRPHDPPPGWRVDDTGRLVPVTGETK